MNRLIFIPGKNPNLSLAELASWFDSQGAYFRITEIGDGFIAAEAERAPEADQLGGMIKVCSLLESFTKKPVMHPGSIFDDVPVMYLPKSKLFGLSVYPDSRENSKHFKDYAGALKSNLRRQGINAKFMEVPEDRSSLTHVEVLKKGVEEIAICLGEEKLHVAKTLSVHNPFEFQKRDVKRPQQRPMYSIPPRLAKTMVNLSRTRESKTLLDPFCGIGGILQEAALMGMDFYGVDIDEECIPHARQNMKWISREYRLKLGNLEKRIQKWDATRLSSLFQPESIDLIVTEPNLGPALKIPPDQNRAERILRGLKPLYEKSFREFSIILKGGGRMCIVLPRFEFGKHFAHAEAKKLAERSGFSPVNILSRHSLRGSFPYVDKEQRHKTIREIWVFEKMPEPPSRQDDLPELKYTKKNFKPE